MAWRHRWTAADGAARETMRSVDVGRASELALLCRRHEADAVGAEFLVTVISAGGERSVHAHAVEIEAWKPVQGELPTTGIELFWSADDRARCARWSIYARISDAFAEARDLRLMGRRSSRDVLRRIRSMLIDQGV